MITDKMHKQVTKCCGYGNRTDWEIERAYQGLVQARTVFYVILSLGLIAIVAGLLVTFGLRWTPIALEREKKLLAHQEAWERAIVESRVVRFVTRGGSIAQEEYPTPELALEAIAEYSQEYTYEHVELVKAKEALKDEIRS